MKQWATTERLTITNTHFPKHPDNITTYTGPNARERQIDFILVDGRTWKQVKDAGSTNHIDLGSDHRTVMLRIQSQGHYPSVTPPRATQQKKVFHWEHVNKEQYISNLEKQLLDLQISNNLEKRCEEIEKALTEAAHSAEEAKVQLFTTERRKHIYDMIASRKALANNAKAERAAISKVIQKELKRETRIRQSLRISKILN